LGTLLREKVKVGCGYGHGRMDKQWPSNLAVAVAERLKRGRVTWTWRGRPNGKCLAVADIQQ